MITGFLCIVIQSTSEIVLESTSEQLNGHSSKTVASLLAYSVIQKGMRTPCPLKWKKVIVNFTPPG